MTAERKPSAGESVVEPSAGAGIAGRFAQPATDWRLVPVAVGAWGGAGIGVGLQPAWASVEPWSARWRRWCC